MPQACRIRLSGRLPEGLTNEVLRRFGPVDFDAVDGDAVITTGPIDQASLRALLVLIWDVGVDVCSVCPTQGGSV